MGSAVLLAPVCGGHPGIWLKGQRVAVEWTGHEAWVWGRSPPIEKGLAGERGALRPERALEGCFLLHLPLTSLDLCDRPEVRPRITSPHPLPTSEMQEQIKCFKQLPALGLDVREIWQNEPPPPHSVTLELSVQNAHNCRIPGVSSIEKLIASLSWRDFKALCISLKVQ